MSNVADWRELPSAEQSLVSHSVGKRQREFATGRILARRLLGEIGLKVDAIGQRQDRTPIWPTGIIGSVSHCDDLCVVAVARDNVGIQSVGIDVEPAEPLPAEIWEEIARDEEHARLAVGEIDLAIGMRRLFSAKEAIYKCLYPLCQMMFEFQELEISFSADYTCFRTRVVTTRPGLRTTRACLEGRQVERDGIIYSAGIAR
jgi:enterobactin synthetase component D / holo-[acyl-carrier protein] synthase